MFEVKISDPENGTDRSAMTPDAVAEYLESIAAKIRGGANNIEGSIVDENGPVPMAFSFMSAESFRSDGWRRF